jgi:hypothetical protein
MRDPDLDMLLLTAAPPPREASAEERVFADVWSRVQMSIADGADTADDLPDRRLDLMADRELAARRRRRATRLASITLAVAVAGAGTAAATDFLATRTGEEVPATAPEPGGFGEVFNMGGTDRTQVFDEETADIAFPPGYEAQRSWALEFFPRETDVAILESSLRSSVARAAVCTWADAWIAADTAGDLTARQDATTSLAEAVTWPDIVANDLPDAMPDQRTGERRSYNSYVPELAAAAQARDRAAVLDAVAYSAACSYHSLPVIDQAPDYVYAGVR